jgi:molybdopterin-containing oxidoreductase family membrane subunit
MSKELEKSLCAVAKLGALLMVVIAFFTVWKIISGIAGRPAGKYEAVMAMIAGRYALNFWIGEIGLGLVLPFAIILAVRAKNYNALFIASLSSILGIFFMRYDLVLIGQIVPHFHGLNIVDQPHLFPYTPTFHEIVITLSGFAFCGFLFLAGERMFRGHLSENHG